MSSKKYLNEELDLKIDNKHDVPDQTFIIHENLPTLPFYATMSAIGGSGKTVAVLGLIRKYKSALKGKIMVFTSSHSNTMMKFAKDLDAKVYNSLIPKGKNIIKELMDFQVERKKLGKMEPVLILLDDYITNSVFNSRRSPIVDLFTKGRHFGISIIVTSQAFNLIPLAIRKLSMINIFFQPFNTKELKTIVEENSSYLPEKEFEQMLMDITKTKYNFLVCDFQKHRYLKNFDSVLSSRF